jgi:phage tail-like protein
MEKLIQLTVSKGDQLILTSIISRPVWTIGRSPDNDLVLADADVYPHHAEVRLEPQGSVLTDLDGTGGTFVNAVRLLPNQPSLLSDGATISIGPYTIVYRSLVITKPSISIEHLPPSLAALQTKLDQLWSRRFLEPDEDGNAFARRDESSSYLQYLPVIFDDNFFLSQFLQIFEAIWEPLEQRQDHIDMYLDPRTCPASFLPWFAGWFELEVNRHVPETRIRSLIAAAIELYRWRGTKYGLARMMEVCTGLKPEITESPSEPFVFHIKVRLPPDGSTSLEEIEKLIQAHKPAHSGYLLEAL